MHTYIFLLLMLVPLLNMAQGDYLILHKGDTVYAKHIVVKSKTTRFRTDSGKEQLPTAEIKEIFQHSRKYWVYEDCEGDLDAFWVLIEGRASFLHSDGNHEGYCPDAVVIDQKIYPIQKNSHFSAQAWNILAKCPLLEEKYGTYYQENRNNIIIFHKRYREVRKKWMEIIRYYNRNCGDAAS
jgi:hypothetical protein